MSDINLFSLCRKVLLQYPYTVEEINSRRKIMCENYRTGLSIDYSDTLTQCAYIRNDLSFHAALLSDTLTYIIDRSNQNFIQHRTNIRTTMLHLNVVSMGSGPGTDMVGVLDYHPGKRDTRNRININFTLVDSESSYYEIIGKVYDLLDGDISAEFKTKNILEPMSVTTNYFNERWVRNGDLFIFSMLFSDIFRSIWPAPAEKNPENGSEIVEQVVHEMIDVVCQEPIPVIDRLASPAEPVPPNSAHSKSQEKYNNLLQNLQALVANANSSACFLVIDLDDPRIHELFSKIPGLSLEACFYNPFQMPINQEKTHLNGTPEEILDPECRTNDRKFFTDFWPKLSGKYMVWIYKINDG